MSSDATSAVTRIADAMNAHDLDAMVACLDPAYRSEQPMHPERGFDGRQQVRSNYALLFGEIPDFHADLLRLAATGDEVWSEWLMHGTRSDGALFEYAGVGIWGIRDGMIAWGRLYFELVERGGEGIDEATRRLAGGPE
jgi:limonene-1,2-epoxide hydrolase